MDQPPALRDVHQAIVDRADRRQAFALAVVFRDQGHTPRKAATKALIDAAGVISGTIGGGAVEAEAQRRAVVAIRTGCPAVFEFALDGESAAAIEPVCGGSMRILLDPTAANQRAVYAQAAAARRQRQSGVLVTLLEHAPDPHVSACWVAAASAATAGVFPGAETICACLADGTARHVVQDATATGARLEALVEPLLPPPLLVIAGGGHVGQAVALQAGLVGFEVLVIDDRPEFTDPGLFPAGVATRCTHIAGELARLALGPDTFVVIVTRGHQQDEQVLAACIRRPAAYIGMIGSRRKVALLRASLCEAGIASAADLDRVYAPIGLDIGAQTVPEIATSIVAQLVAVRRKGSAARMPTA
jgi:xanthine dehydrogenase accessory factor